LQLPYSYLDLGGRLEQQVDHSKVREWAQEAKSRDSSGTLANIWLGEWELGRCQDPGAAFAYFSKALARERTWTSRKILAEFDTALLLGRQGRNQEALDALKPVNPFRTSLDRISKGRIAMLDFQVRARKGLRERNLAKGIPEPVNKLDPQCGKKSLSAALSKLLRKRVEVDRVCRSTGLGNSLEDLKVACNKLGIRSYLIEATPQATKSLPTPLVAYVDHDHFVAVLGSNSKGLDVQCSECTGGSSRRIDWAQWKLMEPSAYLVPLRKDSATDLNIEAALSAFGSHRGHLRAKRNALVGKVSRLADAVAQWQVCGYVPGDGGSRMPHGDPVDVAFHTNSIAPEVDLNIYNPIGPSVAWGRRYTSFASSTYDPSVINAQDQADFGQGWSSLYSMSIVNTSVAPMPQALEGSATVFNPQGSGTLGSGYTWQLFLNGSEVQDNTNPGGWTVALVGSGPQVSVTAPTTLSTTVGYTLVWGWGGGPSQARFDALPPETVRQGMTAQINTTGSTAPGSGLTWDILQGTSTIATSSSPNGWNVAGGSGPVTNVIVSAPASAAIASNYQVQYAYTGFNASQTFSVAVGDVILSTGLKFLCTTDASAEQFTAPSAPTAANPSVLCTSGPGTSHAMYWLFDSSNPNGDYMVYSRDGSYTFFTGITPNGGTSVVYIPTKQYNKVGSYINLNYVYLPTYNGFPVLSTITRSDGETLLTLDRASGSSCQVLSATDCYGRSVYYGYNSSNFLQSVSEVVPTGTTSPTNVETFTYLDGNQVMTSESTLSPTGSGYSLTTFNVNPSTNQITSTVDPEGNQNFYTYTPDTLHTIINIENPGGTSLQSFTVGFDEHGSITSSTDGTGSTVIYSAQYTDANDPYQPSEVVDGDSHATYFTHDTFGNYQSITTPRGVVTDYTWSYSSLATGLLTQYQEGSLPAATFTYYSGSNLLETITAATADGLTGTCSYTYTSLGNLATETVPGNSTSSTLTTTYGYTTDGTYSQSEALGEPITVTDNLGNVNHIRYDSEGRVANTTDPLGYEVTYQYNIANQPIQTTLPLTSQSGTGHGYSTASYVWPGGPCYNNSVYDESANLVRSVTSTYGLCQELVSKSGGSDQLSYSYDAAHRITAITNGNGYAKSYSYNAAGYVSQVQLPGGAIYAYNTYTNGGRLSQMTMPNGAVKNFSYSDPEGYLTSVSYPSYSSQNISYSYDGYGRLSSESNGNASYGYSYTNSGQLSQKVITYPGLSAIDLNYTYNKDGSLQTLSTPAGSFTYSYDGDCRLTSLSNPLSETTSYNYLNNSWLNKCTLADRAYTVPIHNALGQVSALYNFAPSTSVTSEFTSCKHDGAGELKSVSETLAGSSTLSGSSSFTYDSYGRLLTDSSTRTGGYSYSFAYDADGNATTFRSSTVSYNAADQISGTGYTYGLDGSPSQYSGVTATTDVEDRITGFSGYNSAVYGPDGLRVSKTVGSSTTYYVYDGGIPILECNSSGSVTATNTFGPYGLLSRNSGGASTFYQFDQSGNTTARLNSSGAILTYHGEDAFGHPIVSPTSSDPFDGYRAQSGYYTDHETGLELAGRRYYDPKAGRFVVLDPAGMAGGANLYRYVANSPLSNDDPSGEGQVGPKTWSEAKGEDILALHANLEGDIGKLGLYGLPIRELYETALGGKLAFVGNVLTLGTKYEHYYENPGLKTLPGAFTDCLTFSSCVLAGAGAGPAVSEAPALASSLPRTLLHYGDEAAINGINESQELWASTGANGDAIAGNGQYLTDIAPDSMPSEDIARRLFGVAPWRKEITHYVKIDVSDLPVTFVRDGVYLIPNESSLSLVGRIIESGAIP
jgi:RHS repeat-associated protein